MPNDLHLAVAQGFHNAPRLWGDATVRKPTRITGIKSGLIAARREFVYGVYDGFTGVVTQPIGGWRDASASRAIAQSEVADGDRMLEKPAGAGLARKLGGFGTGIAKGLGGLVVKNVSAIITPPAYLGKGVLVWTGKKMEGEGTKKFLRRSHFTVGFVELLDLRNAAAANPAEKEKLQKILAKVGERWKALYVVDKPEKGQKSKNAPSSSSAAAAEKKRTRSSSRPRIEPKDRHKSGTMPLRSSKDERDALTPTPTKEARSTDLDGTATKDAIAPVTKADAKNLAVHNDDSRTADGSGVGGKGHLDPLVPPASSARHPDSLQAPHDVRERDDLPSDTTLATPADEERQDDNDDDDDAEDHKKDSDDMENPTTTTTSTAAPTNLQKVATSPHLEKTTSLTRDFANKKIDEEQKKNGASGKKKQSLKKKQTKKEEEEEANKMENGIKQGGFSPRAMMKGTRFGRRAGGEVEVV
jgi:hypothetical protein